MSLDSLSNYSRRPPLERLRLAPGGSHGTRSIIGRHDGRRIVENVRSAPWKMICSLLLEAPDGRTTVGTGWLAGPRTVVTAGHCVNRPDIGGWVRRILVMPARSSSETPARVVATRFQCLKAWAVDRSKDFDVGVVHLPMPLGEQFGWLGFLPPTDGSLRELPVVSAGYPLELRGESMVSHEGRLTAATRHRIFYDVDTMAGQSGSPVMTTGANRHVIGIHNYGEDATPTAFGIEANGATRITPELFQEIRKWIAASNTAYH